MHRKQKTGKLIVFLLIFAALLVLLIFSIIGSKIPIRAGGFGDFVTSTLFEDSAEVITEWANEYSENYS